MTRFKEIFHQINSSKKRKKSNLIENKENEIIIYDDSIKKNDENKK